MNSNSMLTSSPGVALAAMAVSGTVILLALRLQRSASSLNILPRPCISYHGSSRRVKSRKNKKKKVHFALDTVEPAGNGEEYRRHRNKIVENYPKESRENQMPANRVALYNGILRDRLVHHQRLASY